MNTIYIKDIVEKSNTSIKAIEDNFGYEPFTRKEYEEMLDRVVAHPQWYGKHHDYYTIESLIKHGIITVVKVETFSRVNDGDRWSGFITNRRDVDIISKDLWNLLPHELRNQIIEVAEDNGDPIGFECKRFYYAWTGVTANEIVEVLEMGIDPGVNGVKVGRVVPLALSFFRIGEQVVAHEVHTVCVLESRKSA